MQVKLRENKRIGSRHHEKRRGRRMNSRVPVRLEWDDEDGKRISADVLTAIREHCPGIPVGVSCAGYLQYPSVR